MSLCSLDAALAAAGVCLLGLTLLVPAWIEVVFRVDPDGGSGALEAVAADTFAAVTIVFALRTWRRRALAASSGY